MSFEFKGQISVSEIAKEAFELLEADDDITWEDLPDDDVRFWETVAAVISHVLLQKLQSELTKAGINFSHEGIVTDEQT